ncbi:MAG TPA: hypothetical protein VII49_04890 [Rhizomicrobium sp.]
MALYEPLGEYLKRNAGSRMAMTFREVEAVIGRKLPASAYRHRPWWANEARGHSHAKAWLQAGYKTEQVDMAAKKLVFARSSAPRGVAESQREFGAGEMQSSQHPLIGSMKGTFTIEPGWDLTKPAMDPDELDAMEANLDRTGDLIEKGLSKISR